MADTLKALAVLLAYSLLFGIMVKLMGLVTAFVVAAVAVAVMYCLACVYARQRAGRQRTPRRGG